MDKGINTNGMLLVNESLVGHLLDVYKKDFPISVETALFYEGQLSALYLLDLVSKDDYDMVKACIRKRADLAP